MGSKRLTVFTPTYNRAYTLPVLYESLCSQSTQDFEWIIVDDGSTDNTKDLVAGWIKEAKISIRYFYQRNAGKMAAHNFAVDKAESELFMCLDSDDRLCQDAVCRTVGFWDTSLKNAAANNINTDEICGFVTYKEVGSSICRIPITSFLDKVEKACSGKSVHLADLQRAGLFGETSIIARTDILRKHKYPSFEGERFITDAYLWEKLDSRFSFFVMPSVTQICEYNPDGYSHNYRRLLFSNPLGYRAYHNQRIALNLRGKIKSVLCYDAISIRLGFKGFLSEAAAPALSLLMLPAGFCKYIIDSYRIKTFKRLC